MSKLFRKRISESLSVDVEPDDETLPIGITLSQTVIWLSIDDARKVARSIDDSIHSIPFLRGVESVDADEQDES